MFLSLCIKVRLKTGAFPNELENKYFNFPNRTSSSLQKFQFLKYRMIRSWAYATHTGETKPGCTFGHGVASLDTVHQWRFKISFWCVRKNLFKTYFQEIELSKSVLWEIKQNLQIHSLSLIHYKMKNQELSPGKNLALLRFLLKQNFPKSC